MLFDLIYGDVNWEGIIKNLNGIRADDDYIMAKIYYEADLDNLFFRKNSSC